jgi:perosamine synthetase
VTNGYFSKAIPLNRPSLDDREHDRVRDAIKSGWLTQNGSEVTQMEDSLQNYFRERTSQHDFVCKVVSNGTTALHLALIAAGVQEGDEVVIPNFAYAAVANSILYCHAVPILVDVDENTWNLDINLVSEVISEKTKAVILVDNYGREADYSRLRASLDNNITIIRDACESFPFVNTHYDLEADDIVTNSFYANKIITSGEGGSIFGSETKMQLVSVLRNQGVENAGTFQHSVLGYNYRISNLHAAIFNSQWAKLETLYAKRRLIFETYATFFRREFPNSKSNAESTPWLFTVQFKEGETSKLRKFLKDKYIETRPGFTPFHNYSYLEKYKKGEYPVSQNLSRQIISFPTFPNLEEYEMNFIFECLINYKDEVKH